MEDKDFKKFIKENNVIHVEFMDDWEMRLWFEYGDFIDVHSGEDGFYYTYQGELYENRDNSKLVSDLIEFDTRYINDLVKKYGNESYESLRELMGIAP